MKEIKILSLFLIVLALAGCSPDTPEPIVESEREREMSRFEDGDDTNILIAYFSYPIGSDLDVTSGASVVENEEGYVGLVEQAAIWLNESTTSHLFAIEPAQDSPQDVGQLIQLVQDGKEDSGLMQFVENMDAYDTILLGYPNWWGSIPNIVLNFLESHDFSGKRIIPFTVHGGTGLSNTIEEIQTSVPKALVSDDPMSISRNELSERQDELVAWIEAVLD